VLACCAVRLWKIVFFHLCGRLVSRIRSSLVGLPERSSELLNHHTCSRARRPQQGFRRPPDFGKENCVGTVRRHQTRRTGAGSRTACRRFDCQSVTGPRAKS
jgi:hypothetical protein